MARRTGKNPVIEDPLGTLGLVLIGLTAWGVEQLQTRTWIGSIPARLVLAAVSTVGWIVDRLPHWMVWSGPTSRQSAVGP